VGSTVQVLVLVWVAVVILFLLLIAGCPVAYYLLVTVAA